MNAAIQENKIIKNNNLINDNKILKKLSLHEYFISIFSQVFENEEYCHISTVLDFINFSLKWAINKKNIMVDDYYLNTNFPYLNDDFKTEIYNYVFVLSPLNGGDKNICDNCNKENNINKDHIIPRWYFVDKYQQCECIGVWETPPQSKIKRREKLKYCSLKLIFEQEWNFQYLCNSCNVNKDVHYGYFDKNKYICFACKLGMNHLLFYNCIIDMLLFFSHEFEDLYIHFLAC